MDNSERAYENNSLQLKKMGSFRYSVPNPVLNTYMRSILCPGEVTFEVGLLVRAPPWLKSS